MTDRTLSRRDESILSLLFDPEAQPHPEPGFAEMPLSTTKPSKEKLEEITLSELKAIELAERGSLKEAEALLTAVITKYPTGRATLWNNRAQVRRLAGNIDGALRDLDHVVDAQSPAAENDPVSQDIAKQLSDAHIHRATIYLLLARKLVSSRLESQCGEALEERASREFALAGRYGSELGRVMAVRTNPFAKMCSAIVQTALRTEMQANLGLS